MNNELSNIAAIASRNVKDASHGGMPMGIAQRNLSSNEAHARIEAGFGWMPYVFRELGGSFVFV